MPIASFYEQAVDHCLNSPTVSGFFVEKGYSAISLYQQFCRKVRGSEVQFSRGWKFITLSMRWKSLAAYPKGLVVSRIWELQAIGYLLGVGVDRRRGWGVGCSIFQVSTTTVVPAKLD